MIFSSNYYADADEKCCIINQQSKGTHVISAYFKHLIDSHSCFIFKVFYNQTNIFFIILVLALSHD